MALGAPSYSGVGGGGGGGSSRSSGGSSGFWNSIANQAQTRSLVGGTALGGSQGASGSGGYQTAMSDWLRSQGQASNSYYNNLMAGLGGQLNSLNAYTGNQANSLNTNAGLAGQLLNQSRYRDVTLGQQSNDLAYQHAQSTYGNQSAGLANQLNVANRTYDQQRNNIINQQTGQTRSWAEEQRYIAELQKFAGQEYNLQNDALNTAEQANARDLGEMNRTTADQLQRMQEQLGLDQDQLRELSQMSAAQRDRTLQDLGAARGFTDRDFTEAQNALRFASQMNSRQWEEAKRGINAGRDLSTRGWEELQRDLAAQGATTDEQIAIQRWLNQQNVGSNDAQLDLAQRQAQFAEQQQQRQTRSDAIARGAGTAAGTGDDRNALREMLGFTSEGNRQQHLQASNALQAQSRGNENQYQAALDQLTAAYNSGQLGYDADLEALLSRENQGRMAFDQGSEDVRAGFARSQLQYDSDLYGLRAGARDARAQHDDNVARDQMSFDQQRAAAARQVDAIRASQRQGQNQYQDVISQIEQQRGGNLLGYQQQAAGLTNRFNTGEIGNFNARNALNNQALLNTIGIEGTRTGVQNQQNALRNQLGYDRGQYGIQNDMLRSLGQTYGTRNQQNQAGLQQALNDLYYQQSTGIAGLNQQRNNAAMSQQQAMQQLLGQVNNGFGGRYY